MPADTPRPQPAPGDGTPATSRRARRAAERAAQLEAELAGQPDVVTTGQMPLGEAELPARPAEQAEPRELLARFSRSEEHTSELQSRGHLVCRLPPAKKQFFESSRVSSINYE